MMQWLKQELAAIMAHGGECDLSALVDKALRLFGHNAEFHRDMVRAGVASYIKAAMAEQGLRFVPDSSLEKRAARSLRIVRPPQED
jgi:hypothetical protein